MSAFSFVGKFGRTSDPTSRFVSTNPTAANAKTAIRAKSNVIEGALLSEVKKALCSRWVRHGICSTFRAPFAKRTNPNESPGSVSAPPGRVGSGRRPRGGDLHRLHGARSQAV